MQKKFNYNIVISLVRITAIFLLVIPCFLVFSKSMCEARLVAFFEDEVREYAYSIVIGTVEKIDLVEVKNEYRKLMGSKIELIHFKVDNYFKKDFGKKQIIICNFMGIDQPYFEEGEKCLLFLAKENPFELKDTLFNGVYFLDQCGGNKYSIDNGVVKNVYIGDSDDPNVLRKSIPLGELINKINQLLANNGG